MSEEKLKEKIEQLCEEFVEGILEAIKEEKRTNSPIWGEDGYKGKE